MNTDTSTSAAHNLEKVTLPNDWVVIEKVVRKPGSTGGHFSIGYLVKKGNQIAYLKALNVMGMMKSGQSLIDVLSEVSQAHRYERDLFLKCKDRNLSKVNLMLDHGEISVDGYIFNKVPYLIFEKADDDIRAILNFSDNIDIAWKLKSLHNVAVGLSQLHKLDVAHQDLKPSNVFVFNRNISKIGDLGRSLSKEIEAPHKDLDFPGDLDYSPPEIWYGYIVADWNKRVFSIDLFLFGNLISFYFSGLNMSSLITKNLDPQFHFSRWKNTFPEVVPYLIDAFEKSLDELVINITKKELSENIRNLVSNLCHPDPERRGDRRTLISSKTPYDLSRIISRLDLLYLKAEYNLLH
jgi:eukaryotic-like serine/threonine-protein kinase